MYFAVGFFARYPTTLSKTSTPTVQEDGVPSIAGFPVQNTLASTQLAVGMALVQSGVTPLPVFPMPLAFTIARSPAESIQVGIHSVLYRPPLARLVGVNGCEFPIAKRIAYELTAALEVRQVVHYSQRNAMAMIERGVCTVLRQVGEVFLTARRDVCRVEVGRAVINQVAIRIRPDELQAVAHAFRKLHCQAVIGGRTVWSERSKCS